jgi:ATP-binding cassette subfamily B protein
MSDAYFDDENYGDEFESSSKPARVNLGIWKQLLAYATYYRTDVIYLACCAFVVAICEIAFPLITRGVIDEISEKGIAIDLFRYAGIYAGFCLALALAVIGFLWFGGKLRSHISHDIRRDGFKNLQNLSFSYYDYRPVGWLMARMTSDCERLSDILAWGILDFVWSITIMTGIAGAMLFMEPVLALVVLTTLPLLVWISLFFQSRILKSARQVRKTNSRITGSYNENIMGVATSKTFVTEAENLQQFGGLTDQMYESSVQNAVQAALYLPMVMTLGSLASGIALVIGGVELGWGVISVGTLIAFLTYSRHFFEPIEQMAHWFAEMQMAQASAERIMSLIAAKSEIEDSPEVKARLQKQNNQTLAEDGLSNNINQIEFRQVGFSYAVGGPVLQDINLTINKGETIAIVGSTGSGKTSLISLLCRFYEPTTGKILLDGVDYRERGLNFLQSNLGIVLQSSHVFAGTVEDNILYGNLHASHDQIVNAAKQAGAHYFIKDMPDGYATQIGESGSSLSAGQKQLISFARAILADPKILIMDEATSSVDTLTEQHVQTGLKALLQGRISVVIAHRLSTIRNATRILVVEQGRIIEEGNHEQLMEAKGRYHRLYRQQRLSSLW